MRKPIMYDFRKMANPDDPIVKKYDDWVAEQDAKIIESTRETVKRIYKQKPALKLECINIQSLKNAFLNQWKKNEGFDFNTKANNGQSNIFLFTLMYYFAQNENFFKSPLLYSNKTIPALNKGLLIIGPFGVGKSKIMKVFQDLFFGGSQYQDNTIINDESGCPQFLFNYKLSFASYTANSVVLSYEGCQTDTKNTEQMNKRAFWSKMLNGKVYFDDVLTEDKASNYGKIDLFSKILQERYANKRITFITCNYKRDAPLNQEIALQQFATKYGTLVYDRLFEMFNIIFLTGESLRR